MDDFDSAIDAFHRREARGEGTDRWLRFGDPEVAFERKSFLDDHPWAVFRASLDQRLEQTETRSRLNWTLWFSGLAFACSAAVVLVVVGIQPPVAGPGDPGVSGIPGIRSKGGGGAPVGEIAHQAPLLRVFVNGGEALHAGDELSAGDELTFRVDSGRYDHVMVFGVEDSGRISPYYPDESGGTSLAVGRGRGLWLPDSVELDDSPSAERLIAIFSARPLRWARVEQAAEQAWTAGCQRLDCMGRLGIPGTEEASVWFARRPSHN